ncbi:MAG: truB [Thermoleophilia bacterium]|nr:truB [Thermoleophilia bacterium]
MPAVTDQLPAGFILVDKPEGPSSHSAVQAVRRALGASGRRGTRAGHAGTLDPFATGLLVVLVGRATRLMPWVVGHDKRYLVDVRFGAASDTDDATGTIMASDADRPEEPQVQAALAQLAASTSQVPPAVSAIHVDGVRAYRRVRRGEVVEVPRRAVRFDAIELVAWREDDTGPVAVLDVRCGTGTYMRALARDLGEAVGCPALCSALRRLEVGEWTVAGAPAPDAVTRADLRDASAIVADRPVVRLDATGRDDVVAGRRIDIGEVAPDAGAVALLGPDGALVAMAEPTSDGTLLQPRTVLADPTPPVVRGSHA